MSRYSILLLLCISQYSIAQNKTAFLEYLIDNKLYSELNSALRRNETNDIIYRGHNVGIGLQEGQSPINKLHLIGDLFITENLLVLKSVNTSS